MLFLAHRSDCSTVTQDFRFNLLMCYLNMLSYNPKIQNLLKYFSKQKPFLKFLSKYYDINIKEKYHQVISRIEDKHINGLNGTLDLLDFYVNQHNCWTLYEPNINCNALKPTIKMLSPFGKCHTYLMGNYSNELFVEKIDLLTSDEPGELKAFLKRKFILHSSNHLPIWTSNQFRVTDVEFGQKNNFIVTLKKIEMNKLPPPYDKMCKDYSEKQQFDCMNECIEQYYKQKFKCFPNKNNYYTIMVDNHILSDKFIFCNESEYIFKANNNFASICQSECGEPCSIINFDQDLIPVVMKGLTFEQKHIQFIFDNVDYLKIIWLPQLTIISLFIKIVNIWSLWNGINFKQLIDIIIEYVKQFYLLIFRNININNNWRKYFNYQITKVRILLNIHNILRYLFIENFQNIFGIIILFATW